MQTSIFIGKVLGIYMLITCIALLFNQKYYRETFKEIIDNKSFFIISAIISLIIGILIIITHNIWIVQWQLLITILGWIALLKGIFLLFFPNASSNLFKKCKTKYKIDLYDWVKWWCLIGLFLAAYLIYMTFLYN